MGVLVLLAGLTLLLSFVLSSGLVGPTFPGGFAWLWLDRLTELRRAITADMVNFFGASAWLLPIVWTMLVLTLLLENGRGIWVLRLAGSCLLTLLLSVTLAFLMSGAEQLEYAGQMGVVLAGLMEDYIPNLLVAPLLLLGCLIAIWLTFDRLLIRLTGLVTVFVKLILLGNSNAPISPEERRLGYLSGQTVSRSSPSKVEEIPIRVYTRTQKEKSGSEAIAASLEQASQSASHREGKLPPLDLLDDPDPFPIELHEQKLRERAAKLEQTFADFGYHVRVVGINTGPVITQYEVALETGLRVNKVTCLADDLALNLKVPSVRIVAPIPGKDTVGIEIPNDYRATVRMKEVVQAAGLSARRMKIPLFLGKDTEGRPLVYDLADMPHLLIAGRTGTGKSVCMNAIILSILMTRRPDEVQMIMIDPKMLELSEYGNIPHLIHPVVKDVRKAEAILAWAVDKMEERYDLLSRARVRNIAAYNELGEQEIYRRVRPEDEEEKARIPKRMPYIVIFVDEMNDLMMTMRKEVEGHIIRLAQKSRAAGIHLVVATQKPTVDVITGLIKSNLPARICFQVSSRSDSRVVLDEIGAEKLLGKGDMLFLQPGTSTLVRAQGTYASDREITRVVEYLAQEPCYSRELIQLSTSAKKSKEDVDERNGRRPDELYEQAVEIVVREQRGSVSLLQRVLGIGYGRAARLIDWMAEDGIVGGYNGSNARQVLIKPEEWETIRAQRGLGVRLNKDV